ncbi:MAG: ATP synthase subunit I [Clostridiaceae bacterium]
MGKETNGMLKIVLLFDSIIVLIAGAISFLLFRDYMLVAIIGLILAVLNFVLNAVITSYTFFMTGKKIFYLLGSLARIAITVTIALLLCKTNPYNFVAFLTGYSLHYIAVVLYGLTRKNKKGSD